MFQLLVMIFRLVAASLLSGAVLSTLDLSAAEMLAGIGLTPERITELTQQALAWALPNIILGSMVIVPLWCVAQVLRPPRQ